MFRKWFILILAVITIFPFAAMAETNPNQPAVLTLDQCLKLAYANSQQLKAASQKVTIAQEGVKQAEAGFWPTAGYEVIASNSDGTPKEYYTGKISLTQPLYTGGMLTYALDIAKANLEKTVEEERQIKQNLTNQVKETYYSVWLASEYVEVAHLSYDNVGRHVAQVNKLFQVGAVSKFELLRAQVQHESLKPEIITSENKLATAKLSLAMLIGFDQDQPFTASYNPDSLQMNDTNGTLATLLTEAYQNRSEIHQLIIAARIAKIQTDQANAANKPKLDLSLYYKGEGAELSPNSWDKSINLALAFSGNFFDGTTKPKINIAQSQEELLKIQESGLRDQIRLEVQKSLQAIKESIETIKAHQANIDLSKESLRMTQARFDAGMATTMDIMDAQLALDEALNGYYKGINSYLTALANLDLVTGKNF